MSDGRVTPLTELHRRYIVEETASALRHDLRNKFTAIANARTYLKRRFETGAANLWQDDARVPKFFELIRTELVAAEATLTTKLPAPLADPVEGVSCDVMAIVLRRIAETAWPAGINVKPLTSGEALVVSGDALEVELAVLCLIENAIDAGSNTVGVQCAMNDAGRVVVEIVDDGCGLIGGADRRALEPFFSTKPGRLGVGLNIVKRVAFRVEGKLELAPRPDGERGARAALLIPTPGAMT